MNDQLIHRIVSEVISRLAQRIGADGRRGCLVIVFTGATVGMDEAMGQVRSLLMMGYQVKLAFTRAARDLYGLVVEDQMAGFSYVTQVDPARWLGDLTQSCGVACPLMSVNTASKLTSLIADNTATNLILHALFMGKPVVAARNGAYPRFRKRSRLGFHKGNEALNRAVGDRLRTLSEYGCCLTDIGKLAETVDSMVREAPGSNARKTLPETASGTPVIGYEGKVVAAADIRHAVEMCADVKISSRTVVTPSAKDLAMRHGVRLVKED